VLSKSDDDVFVKRGLALLKI